MMRHPFSFAIPLILVMAGCSTQTPTSTANPPVPPQVAAAQAINALAQAIDGAVHAAITARDQGKCSQQDLSAIESFAGAFATAGKQADAELRSTDPWATQRTKIVATFTAAGLAKLRASVSPSAQILITSLVTLGDQISQAIGGPVL